jgi:hypothetical protein
MEITSICTAHGSAARGAPGGKVTGGMGRRQRRIALRWAAPNRSMEDLMAARPLDAAPNLPTGIKFPANARCAFCDEFQWVESKGSWIEQANKHISICKNHPYSKLAASLPRTRDGVIVTLGMRVWPEMLHDDESGKPDCGGIVWSIDLDGDIEIQEIGDDTRRASYMNAAACNVFSTREAALAHGGGPQS